MRPRGYSSPAEPTGPLPAVPPGPAPGATQPPILNIVADALARYDYGDRPDDVDRADQLRQAAAVLVALTPDGADAEYGVQHSPGGHVSRVWNEAVARRDGLPAFVRTVGPWLPLPPHEANPAPAP